VDSALVIVGLLLVLTLQIGLHLRIAALPRRMPIVTVEKPAAPAPAADPRSDLLRGLEDYHDRIAEEYRNQIAAGEERVRLLEGQRNEAADIVASLGTLHGEMRRLVESLLALGIEERGQRDAAADVVAALHALHGEMRPLVESLRPLLILAERVQERAAKEPAPAADEPDERKTIEIPPPASGAPAHPPDERRPKVPKAADDASWDGPEEETRLFSPVTAGATAIAVVTPGSVKLDGDPPQPAEDRASIQPAPPAARRGS
jgi:hypothetical protein